VSLIVLVTRFQKQPVFNEAPENTEVLAGGMA
jgi:hypothetical protein